MVHNCYLAGSPYYVEDVLGINMCGRAINGELTHLLLNQPPLCDCHCRRCFMPDIRRGKNVKGLSSEEYCRVIKEAAKAGMFCLEISGEGEPLLSSHLKDIIQCAFDNGFITTLITNGHNLTKEFIRYIFDRNVTLVVSLFSVKKSCYEMDNNLPGSFEGTIDNILNASEIYKEGKRFVNNKVVYRMAIHTTAQADNLTELGDIRKFCDENEIFFSIAPLAPVGGGVKLSDELLTSKQTAFTTNIGHNSIILSSTSKQEMGREVCGTCLYGLNIGYDGNLLFDAHAGYEIGSLLGNVREHTIDELVRRQREFATLMFNNIEGFCPVRDRLWPKFLKQFIETPIQFQELSTVGP